MLARRFRVALTVALPVALGGALVGAAAQAGEIGRGHVVRTARAPSEAVEVPAGTFSMGLSPEAMDLIAKNCELMMAGIGGSMQTQQILCADVLTQLHTMAMRSVFISRFAIGRREVSTAEYRACVSAGMCALDPLVGGDERYLLEGGPLVNVTWWEAVEFCKWRGGRLPTEAEWERAARGDDTRAWPWGDAMRPDDFNHGRLTASVSRMVPFWLDLVGDPDKSDGFELLAPPGSYPWGRGPYGTLDQAGNAAEWVADGWSDKGYEDLGSTNPVRMPTLFGARVVRGGSWQQTPMTARVDARDLFNEKYLPNLRSLYIGFRCAWDRT